MLGIGEPLDIWNGVEKGIDLFDCVAPTRIARTGMIYTQFGRISLLNEKYQRDFSALDEGCTCYTCRNYTRAYVAHLFRGHEMLGATLATIHNMHFLVKLMDRIRTSILEGKFAEEKQAFIDTYKI